MQHSVWIFPFDTALRVLFRYICASCVEEIGFKFSSFNSGMPEISRFYGIVVQMFFNEHNPPHFHVTYGDFKAVIDLQDEVVNGFMPKRALKLIFEWMDIHKQELLENWEMCRVGKMPEKIEPLK